MPLRRFRSAAVAAALVLSLAALLPAFPARAAAGTIVPPIAAAGVDVNGDGLYDLLQVRANVSLTQPGLVWLHVELDVGSFFIDAEDSVPTVLTSGNQNFTVNIPGWKIRDSGWSQVQWTLNLSLLEPDSSYPYSVLLDSYTTDIILIASDYAGSAAVLGAPIESGVVDTNANGLYDALLVNATFTISRAAAYHLYGSLLTGAKGVSPGFILIRDNTTTLAWGPGTHTVRFAFPGAVLRGMNYSGPYTFDVYISATIDGFGQSVEYTVQTAAYASSLFDPPPALFRGMGSEKATDADGDGVYDALVVSLPVHATAAATVAVRAFVTSTAGPCFGSYSLVKAGPLALAPGDATFDLVFPADSLAGCGPGGPYQVTAYLDVRGLGIVNWTLYTTAGYGPGAFPLSARTSSNLIGLQPTDTDSDGVYDLLTLSVPVHAERAADYFLDMPSWAGNDTLDIGRVVHLNSGNTTVFLNVSGINVNRDFGHGLTSMGDVFNLDDGLDVSPILFHVGADRVNASQFESRPAVTLSGNVTSAATGSPLELTWICAFDPVTKFQTRTETDAYGHYSLNLYNGTFEILVAGWSDWQVVVRSVTLLGNGMQDWALSPVPQDQVNYTVRFASASEAAVETRATLAYANQSYRLHADLYGNFDGVANDSELALYLPHVPFQAYLLPFWNAPSLRSALALPLLEADNVSLAPRNVTATVTPTSGSAEATNPLEITFASTYEAVRPLAQSDAHSLQIALPYSNAEVAIRARIVLPSGATGTLVTAGNVSAQSPIPGTWDVVMGNAPTEFDAMYGAVLQIGLSSAGLPWAWLVVGGVFGLVAVLALVGYLFRRRKSVAPKGPEPKPPAP